MREGYKPAFERREEVLRFIKKYREKNGHGPTCQEVGDALELSNVSAFRYIKALRADGLLSFSNDTGIMITPEEVFAGFNMVTVPLVGRIICGSPELAIEDYEMFFNFPKELLGEGEFFALRTHGDSMTDAGINDGDIAIIRKTSDAKNGDIVVALVNNDEATLKRFWLQNDGMHVILEAENSLYPNIHVDLAEDFFSIQGVLVTLIRQYQ